MDKDQKNWLGKHKTITGILIVVFIVFVLGLIGSSTTKQENSRTPSPSSSGNPSSGDCSKYEGTDQFRICNELEDANQEGIALQHPLKGNLTYGYEAVALMNNGTVEWDECVATIDSSYGQIDASDPNSYWSNDFVLPPNQKITIPWGEFVLKDGTRFNFAAKKPNSVDVDCQNVAGVHSRSIFSLQ